LGSEWMRIGKIWDCFLGNNHLLTERKKMSAEISKARREPGRRLKKILKGGLPRTS